jgi:hypothetical protein
VLVSAAISTLVSVAGAADLPGTGDDVGKKYYYLLRVTFAAANRFLLLSQFILNLILM